jgi:hypothetical protein
MERKEEVKQKESKIAHPSFTKLFPEIIGARIPLAAIILKR